MPVFYPDVFSETTPDALIQPLTINTKRNLFLHLTRRFYLVSRKPASVGVFDSQYCGDKKALKVVPRMLPVKRAFDQ